MHAVRGAEGRNGAAKGGTIKALTEAVSPRVCRVVALPVPAEREMSRTCIQRYLPYLPPAGEVVNFDRSWNSRAGVERVMGCCIAQSADNEQARLNVIKHLLGRSDCKMPKREKIVLPKWQKPGDKVARDRPVRHVHEVY